MHRDYFPIVEGSPDYNWVGILDDQLVASLSPWGRPPERACRWNLEPDVSAGGKPLCVTVRSEDPSVSRLPRFVTESSNVVHLSLPLRLFLASGAGEIPSTVKSLQLIGDSDRIFKVDARNVFPNVERLSIAYTPLIFDEASFPSLKYLEIRLDRTRRMLKKLASFPELKLLGIDPCPPDVFESLKGLRLGYLRLNNSNLLQSLKGIEDLGSLTDLWIQSLHKLTDVSALADLPLLEDLTIAYCGRIENADAILDIPSLRRLFVFACRNKALERLIPEIEARSLERLSVS